MADNYARQGQTFRAEEKTGSIYTPVVDVGAHVRTYVDPPQTLTLTGTAQSLSVPAGATHADIYCVGGTSTAFCRYWHGSTNPTSTTGVKLYDRELLESADPSTFSAINSTGSCVLSVEFYKYV